ncbi:P27 family phage terminase small subunit [Streptomyces sp. NPDC046685]|uniref:P27 family phage terminase small subunit n=1 Tax=Streptomyces sp. NPDC046685 TaxID=3157202 RepID=UPI0033EE0C89
MTPDVPILEASAGTGEVDHATVKDLCVCVARIDQAERDLSERGLIVTAERGTVKNGSATIAGLVSFGWRVRGLSAFGLAQYRYP